MASHPPFALVSNKIATPNVIRPGAVLIKDGSIEGVASKNTVPENYKVVDVGDATILPGLVDTHVHVNEPGRTEWEGFASATQAAAAGGVTTILDMPLNSSPVTTTVAALDVKRKAAEGKLTIDCGFVGGVIPGNADDLTPMAKEGVHAFKAFMIHSGINEFPHVREADLRSAMSVLAERDLPLLVHAELCAAGEDEATMPNPRAYQSFLDSRPRRWENDAITLALSLAKELHCRLHIVHLSSADAIEPLARAKNDGVAVTVETCPHYLVFEAESIPDGSTFHKCCPPIREAENREALWKGLTDGVIDMIVSDHSPSTPELKALESGDFSEAWGGIAGLQFSLPSIWTEANTRGIGLERITAWMASVPADTMGIAKKGRIAPGCQADLTVFDLDQKTVVAADIIHHRHKRTPYEGRSLAGLVTRTILAGETVYENGIFPGVPRGRALRKEAA
ncbi:MAG: allantoinase AllB [Elusimicrobia bacterium]|nr:MAG: allantoinase AllB [Elusimicrobiota bacterium]